MFRSRIKLIKAVRPALVGAGLLLLLTAAAHAQCEPLVSDKGDANVVQVSFSFGISILMPPSTQLAVEERISKRFAELLMSNSQLKHWRFVAGDKNGVATLKLSLKRDSDLMLRLEMIDAKGGQIKEWSTTVLDRGRLNSLGLPGKDKWLDFLEGPFQLGLIQTNSKEIFHQMSAGVPIGSQAFILPIKSGSTARPHAVLALNWSRYEDLAESEFVLRSHDGSVVARIHATGTGECSPFPPDSHSPEFKAIEVEMDQWTKGGSYKDIQTLPNVTQHQIIEFYLSCFKLPGTFSEGSDTCER